MKQQSRIRRALKITIAVGALAAVGTVVGCVRVSNGTWYFHSASTPEGWPELTPVGEIEVKEYPLYRAATVVQTDLEREGMSPMFMELFRHIQRENIAMTAPVDMSYDGEDRMASMAFLYRTADLGKVGSDGAVEVADLQAQRFASVGVRGDYTTDNYHRGLALLDDWLTGTSEWTAVGPPRYLGYNSPFVPTFWRYGEVQVPVDPTPGD